MLWACTMPGMYSGATTVSLDVRESKRLPSSSTVPVALVEEMLLGDDGTRAVVVVVIGAAVALEGVNEETAGTSIGRNSTPESDVGASSAPTLCA